jgi:hypothetical protein
MPLKGRIVTTAYRSKRPPRKRKPVTIAGPAIVRKVSDHATLASGGKPEPAAPPPPANDDRRELPTAGKIVTSISRKRARLERAERAPEPDDDPEATARVRAFLERMMRPR